MKARLSKAPMWLLLNAGLASVCAMAQPTSPLVEVRSLMEAGRLPEAGKEIGRDCRPPATGSGTVGCAGAYPPFPPTHTD